MSTKATILMGAIGKPGCDWDGEGPNWHLYRELLDGTTHLEMSSDDLDFEVSPGFVDITIPAEIIEAIFVEAVGATAEEATKFVGGNKFRFLRGVREDKPRPEKPKEPEPDEGLMEVLWRGGIGTNEAGE